jgi:RNA polymerase sigma-70 factor (ECF subfamily)
VRWRVADQLRQRHPGCEGSSLDQAEVNLAAECSWEQKLLEETWEKEWRQNLLEAAMNRVKLEVKEEHFQIFDLVVQQHVPVPEIVKRLGVNRATVYLVKHRISRLVKRHVDEISKKPV